MPGIHDFSRDWDAAVFTQRLKEEVTDHKEENGYDC